MPWTWYEKLIIAIDNLYQNEVVFYINFKLKLFILCPKLCVIIKYALILQAFENIGPVPIISIAELVIRR